MDSSLADSSCWEEAGIRDVPAALRRLTVGGPGTGRKLYRRDPGRRHSQLPPRQPGAPSALKPAAAPQSLGTPAPSSPWASGWALPPHSWFARRRPSMAVPPGRGEGHGSSTAQERVSLAGREGAGLPRAWPSVRGTAGAQPRARAHPAALARGPEGRPTAECAQGAMQLWGTAHRSSGQAGGRVRGWPPVPNPAPPPPASCPTVRPADQLPGPLPPTKGPSQPSGRRALEEGMGVIGNSVALRGCALRGALGTHIQESGWGRVAGRHEGRWRAASRPWPWPLGGLDSRTLVLLAPPPRLLCTVFPVPSSGRGPTPALPQVPALGSHSPRACGPPPGCRSPAGGAGPAGSAAARGPAARPASARPAAAASGLQGQVKVRQSAPTTPSHRRGPGSMPTSGVACGRPVLMPTPSPRFSPGGRVARCSTQSDGGPPSSPSTGPQELLAGGPESPRPPARPPLRQPQTGPPTPSRHPTDP